MIKYVANFIFLYLLKQPLRIKVSGLILIIGFYFFRDFKINIVIIQGDKASLFIFLYFLK